MFWIIQGARSDIENEVPVESNEITEPEGKNYALPIVIGVVGIVAGAVTGRYIFPSVPETPDEKEGDKGGKKKEGEKQPQLVCEDITIWIKPDNILLTTPEILIKSYDFIKGNEKNKKYAIEECDKAANKFDQKFFDKILDKNQFNEVMEILTAKAKEENKEEDKLVKIQENTKKSLKSAPFMLEKLIELTKKNYQSKELKKMLEDFAGLIDYKQPDGLKYAAADNTFMDEVKSILNVVIDEFNNLSLLEGLTDDLSGTDVLLKDFSLKRKENDEEKVTLESKLNELKVELSALGDVLKEELFKDQTTQDSIKKIEYLLKTEKENLENKTKINEAELKLSDEQKEESEGVKIARANFKKKEDEIKSIKNLLAENKIKVEVWNKESQDLNTKRSKIENKKTEINDKLKEDFDKKVVVFIKTLKLRGKVVQSQIDIMDINLEKKAKNEVQEFMLTIKKIEGLLADDKYGKLKALKTLAKNTLGDYKENKKKIETLEKEYEDAKKAFDEKEANDKEKKEEEKK